MDLFRQAQKRTCRIRAEVERLRAVEAEWQRVAGYSAPERFPGLTEEQREADIGAAWRNLVAGATQGAIEATAHLASDAEGTSPAAAQDGSSVVQAPPDDWRWLPGAVWEHRGGEPVDVLRCSVRWVSTDGSYAYMAPGRLMETFLPRCSEMTPENGWRFIGRPAEEPAGDEYVIEFRSGRFLQSSGPDSGGPVATAHRFESREAVDEYIAHHPWIAYSGGIAVPLSSALRKGDG